MENLVSNFNDLTPLSFIQVAIAIILSLLYSFIIARFICWYIVFLLKVLSSYNDNGKCHCLIMVIIGSEIARAFALVGAMSIIRFRNPVKDPRDVAFLFVTITIGMACGVGFYMYATVFTFTIVILMLCMHYYNFGDLPNKSYVIKLVLHSVKDEILAVCQKFLFLCSLLSIDLLSKTLKETIILEIELFKGDNYNELVKTIKEQFEIDHISLLTGESDINA